MTFNKVVNNILNEIPYIDYISKFDLELETKQNVDEFLKYLGDIISGEQRTDKYNNSINLTSDEEKRFFIGNIINDGILKKWISRQSTEDQAKIRDFFKSATLKFATKKPRSQYF